MNGTLSPFRLLDDVKAIARWGDGEVPGHLHPDVNSSSFTEGPEVSVAIPMNPAVDPKPRHAEKDNDRHSRGDQGESLALAMM